MMSTREKTEQRVTVAAPVQRCYEIATDFSAYVEWALDVTRVEILETDKTQRPIRVLFGVEAMGRSSDYELIYDYANAPQSLRWNLARGDIEKSLEGEYVFDAQGGSTDVTYRLQVELKVPMPGFVRRRAEERIIKVALDRLKMRAES